SYISGAALVLVAILLFRMGYLFVLALPIAIGIGLGAFLFLYNAPSAYINRRKHDMDKDVLFAGRFLLVKLESGTPLFNSLIDASQSYGVSGKFFREIVDDINTGTPIEAALERARDYSPSDKFKRLISQIINSLKTGIDVTTGLKSTLREIAQEQEIEIQEYGKKLNSIMLFFMIVAIIVPSLGTSMFIILASFLSFDLQAGHMFLFLFLIAIMQLFFLSLIRSIRPAVDL
ncbi:type II secretion system F family protein, partial [Candidatus Woesearchaeota archaeon]|nr:type II secretion system F family protein [Candidatus Woesearchaeota archaeon]